MTDQTWAALSRCTRLHWYIPLHSFRITYEQRQPETLSWALWWRGPTEVLYIIAYSQGLSKRRATHKNLFLKNVGHFFKMFSISLFLNSLKKNLKIFTKINAEKSLIRFLKCTLCYFTQMSYCTCNKHISAYYISAKNRQHERLYPIVQWTWLIIFIPMNELGSNINFYDF